MCLRRFWVSVFGVWVLVFGVCDAEVVCWFLRWHPRFDVPLQALPLCGAALTFFAAAKKVSKESGLTPLILDLRLRAPNRSSASHGNLLAHVRCNRIFQALHPLRPPVHEPAAAIVCGRPGGKLCVGCSASHVSARTTPIVLFSPEWSA